MKFLVLSFLIVFSANSFASEKYCFNMTVQAANKTFSLKCSSKQNLTWENHQSFWKCDSGNGNIISGVVSNNRLGYDYNFESGYIIFEIGEGSELLNIWKKALNIADSDVRPVESEMTLYFPEDDNYNGPLLTTSDLTWEVGNDFWDISIENPYYSFQCF